MPVILESEALFLIGKVPLKKKVKLPDYFNCSLYQHIVIAAGHNMHYFYISCGANSRDYMGKE